MKYDKTTSMRQMELPGVDPVPPEPQKPSSPYPPTTSHFGFIFEYQGQRVALNQEEAAVLHDRLTQFIVTMSEVERGRS